MAALTTQALPIGGAYTLAAAAGGGDTAETGPSVGGWGSTTVLIASVGSTATTITVDGVAFGPYTTQTAIIPLGKAGGATGTRVNITYNQVVNVSVGVVRWGNPLAVVYGT